MAINRHLLHVKSNQTVTTTVDNESVTRAKLPDTSNIEHGEIAINYHDGYETISIKNDNNEIVEFPNLNAVNTLINNAMSGVQDALTFDETPTANSENPVTSGGIKEYVDAGDKIKSLTTYQSSTPLAVGDTHDQALSKLSKIIDDNETVVARALTELEDTKADKDDLYTKDEVDNLIEETNDSLTQIIEDNELTIATALNDLDSRISNMKGSIEELNEPSESTPLVVGDTYDDAFAKLTKIIRDDEEITARALTDLNETKQDEITDLDTIRSGAALGATALQSETQLSKGTSTGNGNVVTDIAVNNHQITLTMGLTALTEGDLLSYADGAEYDSTEKKIYLKHGATRLSNPIDATDFIKDGMVNTAYVQGSNLVISFNTDAGKQPVEVPIADIFDPSLYYTKEEIDEHELVTAAALTELHDTKQDLLTFDSTPTANSTNPVTSGGIKTSLDSKQDALTFDSTPTANSTNPVTSGGIKEYVDAGDKIKSLTTYEASTPLAVGDTHDQAFAKLTKIIKDNELATAGVLTDLHDTKQDLLTFDDKPTEDSENPVTSGGVYAALSNVNTDHLTEVTYSELKTLRDGDELVPGMFYRITDYQCTTTQENTKSAGHQFDIVLLALSANKLAEEGWAMMHDNIYDVTFVDGITLKGYLYETEDGYSILSLNTHQGAVGMGEGKDADFILNEENKSIIFTQDSGIESYFFSQGDEYTYNYFQNSNLSAWKVWYCLDNDTSRFAWADDRIYIAIHSDNEDYAWANGIKMMRNEDGDGDWGRTGSAYAWIAPDELGEYFTNNETPQHGDILYYEDGTETGYIVDKLGINGTGVIYRLIDEFNNDIKYDFKNIQFKRTITNGQYDTGGTETWCYTLNVWHNDMCQDASIVGNTLPNNDGYINGVYDNNFGYATAYDLYIEGLNTFAFALGDNVVLSIEEGGEYYGIYSNTIGNSFYSNTIGNIFDNNTIGNDFRDNTIGNSFYQNTIGEHFYQNTIGNGFGNNTIGNIFDNNTIGEHFYQNTIGNGFRYNTIGEHFYQNTIGNGFRYNTIGTRTGSTATTIDYVRYIRVEDGVQYVNITTSARTSSSAYLQNITISQGIAGVSTDNMKTITHQTVGDTFQTIYRPTNSQVVSV